MKKLLLFFIFSILAFASFSQTQTYVNPYTKKDGSTVQGYYRTAPNKTNTDNYSTQGNSNPYTGQSGTREKDYSSEAANYGSGQTIQTGPRGGQYYYNQNGNKKYVPTQPR